MLLPYPRGQPQTGPGLWLQSPPPPGFAGPGPLPWPALLALAERIAHPHWASERLTLSLLDGTDRPPTAADHTRASRLLAGRVVAGERWPLVVVPDGSALWRWALQHSSHRMIAANALTRLLWDLSRGQECRVGYDLVAVGRRQLPELPRAVQKGLP